MANERVFIIGGHVVNSRKANSKSSLGNDMLIFNSALRTKHSMLDARFHISSFLGFSKKLLLALKGTIA